MSRTHAVAVCAVAVAVLFCARSEAGGPVLPDFSSAVFDSPLQIDNLYFPLVPGTVSEFDVAATDPDTGETESEYILVEVLNQTRVVAGVETRVVRDRVFVEDLLIEDTFDWYAQDNDGNVWYMGEEVTNFEYDDDGNLLGTTDEGAWETGIDGALPGYIMEADPQVGDHYYQEYLVGEAEDRGEVLAIGETFTTPLGTFEDIVRILDVSLDTEVFAHKYYAPGIGVIAEREWVVATGQLIESVNLIPEPAGAALLVTGAVLALGRRRRGAVGREPHLRP